MKTKLFVLTLASTLILASCGSGEKKEENKEEKKEEAKKEEPKEEAPSYEYTYNVAEEDLEGGWMITISTKGMTVDKISSTLGSNYGAIMGFLKKVKRDAIGAPFAIYHNWTDPTQPFDMEAGMPVDDSTLKAKAPIEIKKSYKGKVLSVMYFGDYSKTEQAYKDLHAKMEELGLTMNGSPWEEYITDPMEEKDTAKWQTNIYYPVK